MISVAFSPGSGWANSAYQSRPYEGIIAFVGVFALTASQEGYLLVEFILLR